MPHITFDQSLPAALSRTENLPSLPAVAVEVLRLSKNDDCTLDEMARVLGRDPALSAKILKLSNSSLFGLGREITTLQRATMVLGLKSVKLMALSFSLASSLPKEGQAGGFRFQEFWLRSLISAVASRSLARLVSSGNPDEAFLCGLLSHIGRLVISQVLPEDYATLQENTRSWPTLREEEEHLGFHNGDVAGALLQAWELPSIVVHAVAFRGRPDELPADVGEDVRELVKLMALSDPTEGILCDIEKGAPLRLIHERAAGFGMIPSEVDSFLIGLESGINETAEMLKVTLPDNLSHERLVEQAHEQVVRVSLGTKVDENRSRDRRQAVDNDRGIQRIDGKKDPLTGLPDREFFDSFLEQQISARTHGRVPRALGVLLFEIDHFGLLADSHGTESADEVMRSVGSTLRRTTRKGDMPARYGKGSFALVAPQTTPFGLKTMAERLRQMIEAEQIEFQGEEIQVTVSCGGACIARSAALQDGKRLVKLADRFLLRAQEAGSNRCEIYSRVQFPGR